MRALAEHGRGLPDPGRAGADRARGRDLRPRRVGRRRPGAGGGAHRARRAARRRPTCRSRPGGSAPARGATRRQVAGRRARGPGWARQPAESRRRRRRRGGRARGRERGRRRDRAPTAGCIAGSTAPADVGRRSRPVEPFEHTTLVVVATNAALHQGASAGSSPRARTTGWSVRSTRRTPRHDGDIAFAVATGEVALREPGDGGRSGRRQPAPAPAPCPNGDRGAVRQPCRWTAAGARHGGHRRGGAFGRRLASTPRCHCSTPRCPASFEELERVSARVHASARWRRPAPRWCSASATRTPT